MWSKSAKEQATDNGYTTIKPKTLVFTLATSASKIINYDIAVGNQRKAVTTTATLCYCLLIIISSLFICSAMVAANSDPTSLCGHRQSPGVVWTQRHPTGVEYAIPLTSIPTDFHTHIRTYKSSCVSRELYIKRHI